MIFKRIREIIKDWNKILSVFDNHMAFVLGYLGYKKDEYILRTKDGITIQLRKRQKDISDIDIVKEVFIDNEYGAIENILKSNMRILDIGANIGCFSLKYGKKIKDGHIYAFEPVRENFVCLRENIILNKYNNITIFNEAITNKQGEIDVFLSQDNVGGHSVFGSQNDTIEKVKSTTLERFFQENGIDTLDVLKIDCEGSEYEILLSCPSYLFKKIHYIIMEQHITLETKLRYDKNSIVSHLRKHGFKVEILNQTYYEGEGLFYMIYAKNKKI